MLKKLLGLAVLTVGLLVAPMMVQAATPAELNDAVLFFVNDPQDLTFMDMNKMVDVEKNYLQDRKLVNDEQTADFFRHVREHGAPNAGTGASKVEIGYVVQNEGPTLSGVLVLKGQFEQAKVIELIRKHYVEHSNEHSAAVIKNNKFSELYNEGENKNPFVETQIVVGGHQAHRFKMPLNNRELMIVSTPDAVLFSSAPRGKRELLNKTLAVVDGKLTVRNPPASSKVVMTFAPNSAEKQELQKRFWARYDAQKRDSLSKKKFLAKTAMRLRQRVIRNKVQFMMDCLEELQESTLTIDRTNGNDMGRTAVLVANFSSSNRAADVKARLVKHLVKEIKRTDNVQDKLALGNVSITSQGKQTIIRCQLRDANEQLQCFGVMSTYVTKGMLDRL